MESTLLLVDNFDKCSARLDNVYAESKVVNIELEQKTNQIIELLKQACDDYKLTWEMVFVREQRNASLQSELTSYSIEYFIKALKRLLNMNGYKCDQYGRLKRDTLIKRKVKIDEVMRSRTRHKSYHVSFLKHKYSTRGYSLRMYHATKQVANLQQLFSEINALQSEINNHPFRIICKQEFSAFLDTIKEIMKEIKKTSTYRGNYDAQSKLNKLITEGKLTKNYKPVTTSEREKIIMSKNLSTFMSNWRSNQVSVQDIDTTLESFDVSHKFSVLYSLITYPFSQNDTLEMYKYVCSKFFELIDQYPYLVDYDAILNHPTVCELSHQTHYHFFNTELRDHAHVVKLRNHFLRELILRQSQLLLHIDEYGTTVLENLVK